jgi:cytochrome b involved in lipid metabolism
LKDVAGRDATRAFEDVGHSPEALNILTTLCIGVLNKQVWDTIVSLLSYLFLR